MITAPIFRPIAIDPVLVSQPVSGTVWELAGSLSNWLQAQGGMIVPWAAIGATITAGTTRSLLFRTYARPRATHRLWTIVIQQTAGATAAVSVALPSAESYTIPAAMMFGGTPYALLETLGARASAEETLAVAITATTNSAVVYSIACWELTRDDLASNANDHGIDLTSLREGRPIYDPDFKSMGGLDAAYVAIEQHVRRWHYYWTAAHVNASTVSGGVTTTLGTFVDVFPLAIKVQGTKRLVGDTETVLHVEVYAGATGGSGEVRATTGLDSATATVTAAGFYQLDVAIACTDLSSPTGGTLDTLQVAMRKTTGSAITVGGVSAFEDPWPP